MFRIYAATIVAMMQHAFTILNRAIEKFVGNARCRNSLTVCVSLTITIASDGASPLPTGLGLLDLRQESFFNRNLLPLVFTQPLIGTCLRAISAKYLH